MFSYGEQIVISRKIFLIEIGIAMIINVDKSA